MDDSIAEKRRAAWTATPFDRCELLLDAAGYFLDDGETDRAVAIWKHLITEGGASADCARLDYAEYLFDQCEDRAAYAQLHPVLEQVRVLSKSWLRALEMVEEREPEIALHLYTSAMDCFEREHVQVPAVASRYVQLAAACRRLRGELQIRLTDVDMHAAIGRLESAHKRSQLLNLLGEPDVSGGRPLFWGRDLLETLRKSSGGTTLKRPADYYPAIERALQAHTGKRPIVSRLESGDWMRLVDLAYNAKHIDDLQTVVRRYDQGTMIEWPPGRNQPCWCGSAVKYKKCCGANRHPS